MTDQIVAYHSKSGVLRKIIHIVIERQKSNYKPRRPNKPYVNKQQLPANLRRDLGIEPMNYPKRRR